MENENQAWPMQVHMDKTSIKMASERERACFYICRFMIISLKKLSGIAHAVENLIILTANQHG